MQLCLKPGGIVISFTGDGVLWMDDRETVQPMAKLMDEEDPKLVHPLLSANSGSWFHRMVFGEYRARSLYLSNPMVIKQRVTRQQNC